jgi:hypothetical protein
MHSLQGLSTIDDDLHWSKALDGAPTPNQQTKTLGIGFLKLRRDFVVQGRKNSTIPGPKTRRLARGLSRPAGLQAGPAPFPVAPRDLSRPARPRGSVYAACPFASLLGTCLGLHDHGDRRDRVPVRVAAIEAAQRVAGRPRHRVAVQRPLATAGAPRRVLCRLLPQVPPGPVHVIPPAAHGDHGSV